VEPLFDHPVEIANLPLRVTRGLRIDVHDVAILRLELQVDILQFVQALRKQPGSPCSSRILRENRFPLSSRAADLSRRAVEGSAVPRTFPGNVFRQIEKVTFPPGTFNQKPQSRYGKSSGCTPM
jgi:hypothetical protein